MLERETEELAAFAAAQAVEKWLYPWPWPFGSFAAAQAVEKLIRPWPG